MKTPYDFLAKLMPKPTPEDEAEALRLGVTMDEYRAMKLQVQFEQARKEAGIKDAPPDIAAEEAKAAQMRREAGFIKPRNAAPNIFVQAAKTPGEVAKTILFVLCYLVGMIALVVLGGERVQKMPGVFQCVILGLMVIPVMMVTGRIWEAIGEGGRDVLRALVRFWPLTLVALIFVLGIIKMLAQRLPH